MTRDNKPYAIVVGLDCITGLQTARILAGRGVPVIAIAKDAAHYCCRTKVCEAIHEADTAGEDLIRKLTELGPKLGVKAVLYPCTDMSVLLISRNREQLKKWYHIALPEPQVIELLMDKISFYTFAEQKGLPIPKTFFLRNQQEAWEAAHEMEYPCILKPPIKTSTWEENTKAKVFKIASRKELLNQYECCSGWAEVLMAQEWVEGNDADLYSCNCYFDAKSEPMVTFIARKLRQWPPETGTSCLGEECCNDVVLDESVRLFRSVNYYGLGYVEMKRDARTGKHYIIEPNIGRPTGRSAIAEAGGGELLYTMYCDCVGLPLPENRQQHYSGVKWIYLRRDIQSALYYWRRGDLTLKEWWKSLQGRKSYAVLSWTDPGPFIADLVGVAGQLITGRFHKAKRPADKVAQRITNKMRGKAT